jgi:hypothetical protein
MVSGVGFIVLGIGAIAGGEVGAEILGGDDEGEEGMGHGFLVGSPHKINRSITLNFLGKIWCDFSRKFVVRDGLR